MADNMKNYLVNHAQGLQDPDTFKIEDKNLQLVQLIELSRHGARAPFYDLFDYRTNWKVPLKTLTNTGMRQHFLIGVELYNRYEDTIFNKGEFTQNQISVVSTSSDRAQQSALSQLYGIYQQKGQNMKHHWKYNPITDLPPIRVKQGQQILEQLNGKNLPNSFIPINLTVPINRKLLEPSEACHGYGIMKGLNFQTDIYRQFEEQLTDFKMEFIEKFGLQNEKSVSDITVKVISDYWDSVICDIYEQIPLPESFTTEFIQKMNFVYDFQQLYINFNGSSGNLLKLQTSTFFNDVIDLVRNEENIKFKFYSASDGNLNSVLISTGVSSYTTDYNEWLKPTTTYTHSNTNFASVIFFEIYKHKETNRKYVRMIYNDTPLQIKDCSSILCDFENEFVPSLKQNGIIEDGKHFDSLSTYGHTNNL